MAAKSSVKRRHPESRSYTIVSGFETKHGYHGDTEDLEHTQECPAVMDSRQKQWFFQYHIDVFRRSAVFRVICKDALDVIPKIQLQVSALNGKFYPNPNLHGIEEDGISQVYGCKSIGYIFTDLWPSLQVKPHFAVYGVKTSFLFNATVTITY